MADVLDENGVSDKPQLHVARLKVVELFTIGSKLDSVTLARLREFREEGLSIRLRDNFGKPISF
jgi:hypothetical protein